MHTIYIYKAAFHVCVKKKVCERSEQLEYGHEGAEILVTHIDMALSNKLILDKGLFHNSCEMKVHISEIPIITLPCVLDNRRMWKNYNFNRAESYFICELLKQASFQKKTFFL